MNVEMSVEMPMYIEIVGIDGSGKSALSFKLFKALSHTAKAGYVADKIYCCARKNTYL